jgi:uncharacterized protein YjgD (DUF1641 family)
MDAQLNQKLDDIIAQIEELKRRQEEFDELKRMVADLAADAELLTKPVFLTVTEKLDRLEKKGYFGFLHGVEYVLDQIVSEFDEEDVCRLGDNIVTILATLRNTTQPEIMVAANTILNNLRTVEPVGENVSTWGLLRELGDPQVRRGLARMLHAVKTLAEQPEDERELEPT